MGGAPVTRTVIDDEDTQGLLRFGYRDLREATYVLLRVRNAAAARAWLGSARLTSAVLCPDAPDTALQVAFTAQGLSALGVPVAVINGFSHEFVSGVNEPSRSRRLGDVGPDEPGRWTWGGNPGTTPHVLVMFFARPGKLQSFMQRIVEDVAWMDGFEEIRRLTTTDLDDNEPFGFKDGISQPEIDWALRTDAAASRIGYDNRAALGEFVLGYPNEYGKYTERPLLDPGPATRTLPSALDAPRRKDLGRNGTYLVMRQLRQDVAGFWRFLEDQAKGDRALAERLGSVMVGRTKAGDPLVTTAPSASQNDFDFDDDPLGATCPIGAHIRRANPRNADYVGHPGWVGRLFAALGFGRTGFRDDLTSSVRFHRILRRGREYERALSPEEIGAGGDAGERVERGLHFVCLNANISRQFEFVQNAWAMNDRFSGLPGENDPLIGNHVATASGANTFTVPNENGMRQRVSGIPQFVTVRGGAYFFLPGLRAMRYFAAVGSA